MGRANTNSGHHPDSALHYADVCSDESGLTRAESARRLGVQRLRFSRRRTSRGTAGESNSENCHGTSQGSYAEQARRAGERLAPRDLTACLFEVRHKLSDRRDDLE
jgi:hypothetical protein